ncbi:MAG: hypothetical protein ACRD4H_03250 [Candidatus Acidiferrales bacterium]
MSPGKCLSAALLIVVPILTAQPVQSQQPLLGFKGRVASVLTEEFASPDGASREPNGSTLDIYDPAGNEVEFFRYKPDSSVWQHIVYYRNGPRVFRVDETGTAPYDSQSEQTFYDAEGHELEHDMYDANGVLTSKSTYNLVQQLPNSTISEQTDTKQGAKSTTITTETTDPQTGITHQIATKNGQPYYDWVFHRSAHGADHKIIYADGSYAEHYRRSDGTTIQDSYYAPDKSHNYEKLDALGHTVEVIFKSNSNYLRCTYLFDKAGRQTAQINYDASGNILEKTTAEYRDDSHGNWIEKKSIVWNTKAEPMQPETVTFTLRIIDYY